MTLTCKYVLGNKLHGILPSLGHNESLLSNFLVSNNLLTGTIPESIQRHAFSTLDLSNNRLQGTLLSDFNVASDQISLSLSVNRLSGPLPLTFYQENITRISSLTTLNILASNIFTCSNYIMPNEDPNANSYSCGSFDFNMAIYVFCGLMVSILLMLFIIRYFYRTNQLNQSSFLYQSARDMISWYQLATDLTDKANVSIQYNFHDLLSFKSKIPESIAFLITLNIILKWTKWALLFNIIILIPIYAAMNSSHQAIVSYQYGYIISMVYLHGYGIVILIGLVLILLWIASAIVCSILSKLFHEWIDLSRNLILFQNSNFKIRI